MNQVRIYHPGLDRTISVPETAVTIHKESGWIPADEYVPPAQEQAEEAAVSDAGSGEQKAAKATTTRAKSAQSKEQ